jgi:hypothetical protein
MSDTIISVENLGKRYRLGAGRPNERYTALRDVIARKATAPWRAFRSRRNSDKASRVNGSSQRLNLPLKFLLQTFNFLLPRPVWSLVTRHLSLK